MFLLRAVFSIAVLAAAPAALAQREKLSLQDLRIVEERWPDAKRTPTGLRYVMLTEGEGESPRAGDLVAIIYRGTFLDGTMFDEDWNRVRPFAFRLGRNLVIQGMDEGIRLMKPGGRAIIIVPAPLAYGTRGDPPKIAPNTTLVFEIELLGVQQGVALDTPLTPPAAPGVR